MSHRKRGKVTKPADPLQTASIFQVLGELSVHEWEVLLIGDGSGSGWDRACGWASILIERQSARRKTFFGAMNLGTVNIGEVKPYVHALAWYSEGPGRERLHGLRSNGRLPRLPVHIITDSEIIANQGSGVARRKANRPWWAALDELAAMGYDLNWHWMARDRLGLNMLMDYLSRAARKAVESVRLPAGVSEYDLNPGPYPWDEVAELAPDTSM
jgi:hypothetical protein